MVNLGRGIVFRSDLLAREGENTRITGSRNTRRERTQQSAIRKRVKGVQESSYLRVYCYRSGGAAVGGSAQLPTASGSRGHRIHLRDPLRLSQPLVSSEKECLLPPNGAANRSAKLITAERRLRGVEEISRIEGAVAQVFKHVAVETIRAGTRGSRDNPAR